MMFLGVEYLSASLTCALLTLALLALLASSAHALTHKHELALLRLVSSLFKTLLALGGSLLLLRYNAAMLVHNKVTLLKVSLSLVSSAVVNLSARSNQHLVFLTSDVVHSVGVLLMTLHYKH